MCVWGGGGGSDRWIDGCQSVSVFVSVCLSFRIHFKLDRLDIISVILTS